MGLFNEVGGFSYFVGLFVVVLFVCVDFVGVGVDVVGVVCYCVFGNFVY